MSSAGARSVVGGVGVVFLSALAGWLLAGLNHQGEEAPVDLARSNGIRPQNARSYALPSAVGEKLQRIRRAGTVQERLRATLSLAESLSVDEFRQWVEHGWFDVRAGYELALFHKVGFAKWVDEDPLGYVAWAQKNGREDAAEVLVKHLQGNSSQLDAYLEGHPDPDQELHLSVISALVEVDPKQAVGRARDLLLENHPSVPWWFSRVVEDLVNGAPAELSPELRDFPPRVGEWAKELLLADQLKTSFDETLASLQERPDGTQILRMAASRVGNLGEKLLERLSDLPASWKEEVADNAYLFILPGTAERWLQADLEELGMDESQVRRIKIRALSAMGDRDPEGALRALASANLTAYDRQRFLEGLLSPDVPDVLAQRDWLSGLTSNDQRLAEEILDRREAQRNLTRADSWMERVLNPIEGDYEHRLADATLRWSPQEVARFQELLPSMPAESRDLIAELFAESALYEFKEHTVGIVGDALRHVITREESSAEKTAMRDSVLETTSLHALNWVLSDPPAATQWVASLPAGPSKEWAEKNMAAMWSRYDRPAAEAWINALPGERAAAVRQFMKGGEE